MEMISTGHQSPVDSPNKELVIQIFGVVFDGSLNKPIEFLVIWEDITLMWRHLNAVEHYPI